MVSFLYFYIITANIGKDKMQTNYTVGFILLKFL